MLLLTIEDHASSNGCWVSYSLGHGRETAGVTVHHQADVFGLQFTCRVTKTHIVPQDDHVSLTSVFAQDAERERGREREGGRGERERETV